MDTRSITMTDRSQATQDDGFDSDDYRDTGSSHYSHPIGEGIGKEARGKLVTLCLRGYREELRDKPLSRYSRGRPRTAVALVAEATGVSRRTVQRWLDGDGARACDANAGRLAEVSFGFYPEETSRILLGDVEGTSRRLSAWLALMGDGNFATCPCRIIHPLREEGRR